MPELIPQQEATEARQLLELRVLDKSENPADEARAKQLQESVLEGRRAWVRGLAMRFCQLTSGLTANNDLEDLEQEGALALVTALRVFDPEEGAFGALARVRVVGAFQQYARDHGALIRESGHNQEKRARSGASAPVAVIQAVDLGSANDERRCDGDRHPDRLDCIDVGEVEIAGGETGDWTEQSDLRIVIQQALAEWAVQEEEGLASARAYDAIRLHYFENQTVEQIAEALGCGKSQAHRYLDLGRQRLKTILRKSGFEL
jgi:RNA polymerase sigma factor (sigma-70 family)